MSRIRIGDYLLASDSQGWSVSAIKRKGEDTKTPGQEYEADTKYYGSASQALNALLDRTLRASDAKTIRELREELDSFKVEVAALFKLKVE